MKALKELRTYFILFLVGTVGWFTYQMITYPILPAKYLAIVLIALYLISILLGLSQYKGGKVVNILGKIGIILLSLALFFVNFTYLKTVDLFDDIVQVEDTDVISVVVKDKSGYRVIEDLENKTIGVLESEDEFVNQTYDELTITIDKKTYAGVEELVDALMNEEIDSILINESYRAIFEEYYPNFTDETRVIYTKEYQTVIEDVVIDEPDNNTDTNNNVEVEKVPGDDYAKVTINNNINVTQDTFSVYISGIDTYGSISTKSRSDVNMIVTVNPREHKILLTSIPRDYRIPFSVLGGAKDKLTHSGLYGVNETKGNVSRYFGVSIPFYVRVNFTSLVTIVDAIGGITINNPWEGVFDLPVGEAHLDGKMALVYARERMAFGGNSGDNVRIQNQARVITGIINKVCSPEIITNYGPLLDAVGGSFQTNMSDSQMLSLIRMQLGDMRGWSIETQSVGGTSGRYYSPIYGSSKTLYMVDPDKKSVENARDRIASMY